MRDIIKEIILAVEEKMAQKKGTKPQSATKNTNTNKSTKSTKSAAQKSAKKSKGLMIGLGVGALVVVGAIVAAVLMLTGKPDYNKSFDEVQELYAKLKTFTNGSSCEKLSNESGEADVTEDTLKGYIANCKKEVKEISDINHKVGETSGVKKDEAMKKKFDDYNAKWKTLVSNEDGLEKDLQAYITMHQFIVKSEDIDFDEDPEGMLELGNIMINSDNAKLKEYGETWNKNVRKVIDLMDKYKKATSASERTKLRGELMTAVEEMDDFLDDTTLLEESTNFNQENAEQMTDAFEALYKALQSKANE